MRKVEVLGVVISPIIKGMEWECKATFELPKSYCKYLNIKSPSTLHTVIRKKGELITIFLNPIIDSSYGQECIIKETKDGYYATIKNVFLGIKSTDFFEASIVKYEKKRLAIKLQQIKQLPRYMEEK